MPRRWTLIMIATVLSLTVASGCGAGAKQIAAREMDKYSMKSAKEGKLRQRSSGVTLNGPFLKTIKEECRRRGIALTHETYSEGFEGNLSYSYFINGSAKDYVIVHIYPSEQERIRQISELYRGKSRNKALEQEETTVISERGKTALVYTSSRTDKSDYSYDIKAAFEQALDQMTR
ncbi:hypothetical protein [Paenibacillus brevis]|uniref:DUF4358 domain-containing protein n=1 Tax=Paenibacillus brevis TaxID=2841508 RepID=A0ABS6FRX6_9BACL|nr:hypothetical protein [Paenibacillus brevis]MBU5672985.1 hypothetical protein [Paenibacillus brevis]